jgi:DGQHR domain-containing protein
MEKLTFSAIRAQQSPSSTVLSFAASAADVLRFATIDRIARSTDGHLTGFQRPQIAAHIREIQSYLETSEAVLPNPIVVAFTNGVSVKAGRNGLSQITIDVSSGPPGLVVDGQQRLTALSQIQGKPFEIFVSALICRDEAELRRQFVLINNTRPLPKTLIYELLPMVEGGLPKRLTDRTTAADLTARLNHDPGSSLRGLIHQHTSPDGVISDIAIQRVLMNSLSDGALRHLASRKNGLDRCLTLLSEFYQAVQYVFSEAWVGHTPRTSRLVHGAGIVSLGYVMEELHRRGADNCDDFRRGLSCLVGRTAWTEGEWDFGEGDRRHWKAIQNTGRDINTLAQHLVGIVRAAFRAQQARDVEDTPLLKTARA